MYLMRRLGGMTNREVGEILDMKFSAVSKLALGLEKEMEKNKALKKEVACIVSNIEA